MQRRIIGFALSLLITGCAQNPARFQSERVEAQPNVETVSLRSNPAGANAKLSSGESCSTPCSVRKRRDASFTVTFSKEGYRSQTATVTNNLESLRRYNRSRGMKADVEVDTIKLVPNPVSVTLEPEWSK